MVTFYIILMVVCACALIYLSGTHRHSHYEIPVVGVEPESDSSVPVELVHHAPRKKKVWKAGIDPKIICERLSIRDGYVPRLNCEPKNVVVIDCHGNRHSFRELCRAIDGLHRFRHRRLVRERVVVISATRIGELEKRWKRNSSFYIYPLST